MPRTDRLNRVRSPELSMLRSLWQFSRQGDHQARERLLTLLMGYPTPDAFVRNYVRLKIPSQGMPAAVDKRMAKTPWERGRDNFRSGPTSLVRGGAPSLGKRSK